MPANILPVWLHPGSANIADSLLTAGRFNNKQPQPFYAYALVDPLDTPFAIFRFIPKSDAELANLTTFACVQPPSIYAESSRDNSRAFPAPSLCSPMDQPPASPTSTSDGSMEQPQGRPADPRPSMTRRLSIPPSVAFDTRNVGSGASGPLNLPSTTDAIAETPRGSIPRLIRKVKSHDVIGAWKLWSKARKTSTEAPSRESLKASTPPSNADTASLRSPQLGRNL